MAYLVYRAWLTREEAWELCEGDEALLNSLPTQYFFDVEQILYLWTWREPTREERERQRQLDEFDPTDYGQAEDEVDPLAPEVGQEPEAEPEQADEASRARERSRSRER